MSFGEQWQGLRDRGSPQAAALRKQAARMRSAGERRRPAAHMPDATSKETRRSIHHHIIAIPLIGLFLALSVSVLGAMT